MSEIKRITIPVQAELKEKLELIAKNQKRSMSANLEHALEVYAALFDDHGKMLVPLDSILMGDLSSLGNVTKTVQIKNEYTNNDQNETLSTPQHEEEKNVEMEVNDEQDEQEKTNADFGAFAPQ